jgi:transketolase
MMDPRRIRQLVLEMSKRANVGHIGSSLSIAEIIAVLYGNVLRITDPQDPERDRFVLSKGHAAPALYAALHLRGRLSADDLTTFCTDGSLLGVHPEHALTGVDFSTGSLGMGLSFAAGAAYAARLQQSPRRVYALLSDAECNEGSVWEAALFAGHYSTTDELGAVDKIGSIGKQHGCHNGVVVPAEIFDDEVQVVGDNRNCIADIFPIEYFG